MQNKEIKGSGGERKSSSLYGMVEDLPDKVIFALRPEGRQELNLCRYLGKSAFQAEAQQMQRP